MVLVLFAYTATKGDDEEADWRRAKQLDTVEAYQDFLQKHPQSEVIIVPIGKYKAQQENEKFYHAHERIALLLWEQEKGSHQNELEALRAYFKRNYKYAQFARKIERLLINHLEKNPENIAKNRFLLSNVKLGEYRTSTALTITQAASGSLEAHGIREGGFLDLEAIHRWKGTVKGVRFENIGGGFDKYSFIGYQDDPLTFGCVYGVGYVYLHGKGKIVLPDGKEVLLGY
jgi:hypothetical protein